MPKSSKNATSTKPLPYWIPANQEDELEEMAPTLTASDLMKEASKIKEFSGNKDYDLSSFIREVDMILPLFNENPELKKFVLQRHVLTKIQGASLNVIRSLGNTPTWEAVKKELIRNFGVKESYHSLYHQAINLKNFNVSDYFFKLRNILDKLNIKYEFDTNKPVEFSPSSNEAVILKTFLNGINPNLASIVYSRQVDKLRDAFYLLEETGMLRSYEFKNNYQRKHNERNQNDFRTQNYTPPLQNQNHNPHIQTYNPFSQQIRQNPQTSGQFRQNSQQTRNSRFQHPVPMEVDHIQENNESNFQLQAQNMVYR